MDDESTKLDDMDLRTRFEIAMTHASQRSKTKISWGRLAKLCGVARSTVYLWRDGTTQTLEGDNLLKAARVLGVRPEWLGEGRGPMIQDESMDNVAEVAFTNNKVPLISWVQAGDFATVVDNFEPGDGEEWIDTTVPKRRYTFALRVQGDSMEPEFHDGNIIIVEPEISAEHGDYVIVRVNNNMECTFKQLIRDGKDLYLKPLNPRYPIKPMPLDAAIVGVVRAQERRYR